MLKPRVRDIDPMLTDFARSHVHRGSCVWDVGANVGLFTFAASGLAGPTGQVLAIEADVRLAARLRRAAGWNRSSAPVTVVAAAVSDRIGLARFVVAAANAAVNHLEEVDGSTVTGGDRRVDLVPSLTLNALLTAHGPPDVLKIDVEGAELLALTGGGEVLAHAPVVLCEVNRENWTPVTGIFSDADYELFDPTSGSAVTEPAYNVLAVPRSRL